jgi:methyl-accepting chemotaxis protein
LIEIKELAWLARDGVGLERTALIDGLNAKALSPAMRKKATDLRARADVTWTGKNDNPIEIRPWDCTP